MAKPLNVRSDSSTKNLHPLGSRGQTDTTSGTPTTPEPVKDILIRARELGIKIWSFTSTLLQLVALTF